ncbi:MAG TPA: RNA polymerase sigma factor [Thermoanaerobaculia bacterium]|nr:RNA polymerase sigma factor [Thermoanaerobaculia bacterium]
MIDEMRFAFLLPNAMVESRELDNSRSMMDEEEFRAFYERTARPLWSYLSRITGDRQQADDILQEAYYRFYRAGARHEDETHRRNSLFQIATNLVRDAARRAKHHEDVPLEEESAGGTLPVSHGPTPERQAEVRTDLARAMNKLEPVQRELLWLAYAQGASHEEIAGILGLRAVSIRTLLLRARRKMADLLTAVPQEARR